MSALGNIIQVAAVPGGALIPDGGTTQTAIVEVIGQIQPPPIPPATWLILVNGKVEGQGSYNDSGVFVLRVPTAAPGPYLLELKENASMPTTSTWRFTVTSQADRPTIDSITGQGDGKEIGEGTSTEQNLLAFSGKGEPDQVIEIHDNGAQIGLGVVLPTRIWLWNSGSLALGHHVFTAIGRWASFPASDPRTLTVVEQAKRPTIDSVKDANTGNNIPEGSTTAARFLELGGTAEKGGIINLLDFGTQVAGIVVPPTGNWVHNTGVQATGRHSFTAKEDGPPFGESTPPRTLVVAQALTIDQNDLHLNGLSVLANGERSGLDAIGNTAIRVAQGGVGQLRYISSHPQMVSVDATGKVTGLQNGVATISVTDEAQQSVSYLVRVSNVWTIVYLGWEGQTYDKYLEFLSGTPYARITNEMLAVMVRCYTYLVQPDGRRTTAWSGMPPTDSIYAHAYSFTNRGWIQQGRDIDSLGMAFRLT